MINVEDRIVENANRYQLVLVAGTTDTYDLIPVPGTVTKIGTPINRALFAEIQENTDRTTEFLSNGDIKETTNAGVLTTHFNANGIITQTFVSNGTTLTKTTTFLSNVNIQEVRCV